MFIDPLTDFGFKRIFANENHKNITISFLNSILQLKSPIIEIEFQNLEKVGEREKEKKSIFDIFAKDQDGKEIIVELQRKSQEFFIDRAIYYMSRQISDMGIVGEWDYHIKPIYFIAILDFELFQDNRYLHRGEFVDIETKKQMSNKMNLLFIETKKFTKAIQDLEQQEKWIFFLKNLTKMDNYFFENSEFYEAFEIAKYSKLQGTERLEYEIDLKERRDNFAIAQFRKNELAKERNIGKEEGLKQGKIEIAKSMLNKGLELSLIFELTGLTEEEILDIKKS
jgi:predicted transposase/invertase (TIGR01784 family)